MAKFIKSIFHPNEKRRASTCEEESEDNFTPPLGGRRKLSISRSGRMKQSQKLRHALSLDIYGENLQKVERPKSLEYHVNTPVSTPVSPEPSQETVTKKRKPSVETNIKSPEEEIDNAFEIIDKS